MRENTRTANPDRFLDAVLSAKGRLEPQHLLAAHTIHAYMKQYPGTSGGLIGGYREKVDCSSKKDQSRAKFSPRHADFDSVINMLRREEKELYSYLVMGGGEKANLAIYGQVKSGYSSADHSRAFAIGQLRSMLDGLAEGLISKKIMQQSEEMAA